MKVHEVFPILILQDVIEYHQKFKNEYFEELKSLIESGAIPANLEQLRNLT